KTLEAWITLAGLKQRGGAAISVQTLGGEQFDAIVFGEVEPGRWMAGSDGFVRTRRFHGPAETEANRRPVHLALAYGADGTITAYRNGQVYGMPYKAGKVVTFKAGKAQILFGLRHSPAGGNRLLQGVIHRARLYDRALKPEEVAAAAGTWNDFVTTEQIAAR